jgi:Fic/DOC family protein
VAGRSEIVPIQLIDFIRESNRIEGILREPTQQELQAHHSFLSAKPTVQSLEELVHVVQPTAVLRDRPGLDVRVGRYSPPPGGPAIKSALHIILEELSDPYQTHQQYEALHPFTDGNGRSGRALWLWMMGGIQRTPLGFLHQWYYQSLQYYCGVPPL